MRKHLNELAVGFTASLLCQYNYYYGMRLFCISGLAALTKVLIASERRTIPANLHYNNPNPNIPGLIDGRLSVVSQNTKWNGGLVAINSFGFGGTNVHAVLDTKQTNDKV